MTELRAEADSSRLYARGDLHGLPDPGQPLKPVPMLRRRLVPVITELKVMLESTPAVHLG
jgi:hypothetical protein